MAWYLSIYLLRGQIILWLINSNSMSTHVDSSFARLVGRGGRIHWLHLCWGVTSLNERPVYDIKQSDREAPVML